jgi:long-chain acyl-CoA synthetase
LKNLTIPSLLNRSFNQYKGNSALSYVDGIPISYGKFESEVNAVIAFLEELEIKPWDKVAIFSPNMPNWGIAYVAITSMNAIAVPLMPEFSIQEIENTINHSDSKAIFISDSVKHKIDGITFPNLQYIISIEEFALYNQEEKSYTYLPGAKPVKNYQPAEDDVASILYTSGTTGKSKGVMLTHKNICSNALAGAKVQPIEPVDRFLSILPLSHTYENTLGFILAMLGGACVYYLQKPPTANVLLPALQKIRPTIMLSVPLIIEKIYRNKILPSLNKNALLKALYKIPFIRKKLHAVAGKKLLKTFGGELKFFGIGGAKLDKVVEQFLIEAGFPYAIGYGLTETAPLVAGVNPGTVRLESTGPAIYGVEIKIHNPSPDTGEGEIWVKGPNVMKGYYKEPQLTDKVLTRDGWFKTGDLGVFDKDNFLYIKGRIKNMIVGANGKNIYPEEIESVINNFMYVLESLVVEKKGKLVAMVHFNKEELEKKYQDLKSEVTSYVDIKVEELTEELRDYVNSQVSKFARVQVVVPRDKPFQKTATHKIKRFLYT